ncbi:glyoxalase [Streptococcus anginosus]|uniref:glyoxalase n=1 Tax=Streptococcus anginosus TaxID=1328 RepID=UPI0034A5B878
MKIEHAALYVQDLEGAKCFFETYFEAKSNQLYHNQKTGFQSYFLSFNEGARLEIMTRKEGLAENNQELLFLGYHHSSAQLVRIAAIAGITRDKAIQPTTASCKLNDKCMRLRYFLLSLVFHVKQMN